LADCIKFFQENKGLIVFGYVFMPNHIHIIFQSSDAVEFVRDFKKWTSRAIKQDMVENEPRALELFIDEAGEYQFWKDTNAPKIIETENFGLQKLQYIHNNPVVKGYVLRPECWKWSSANQESDIKVERI
jgi:REP element-mobilizing transposase RayT